MPGSEWGYYVITAIVFGPLSGPERRRVSLMKDRKANAPRLKKMFGLDRCW